MIEPNSVSGYYGSPMDRRADALLVDDLLARDESALRTAMKLYRGVVYGMARRVVAEPSLAEEVAQDTFLALWRRPGAYDPDRGSLQSFLVGVARNKAIDLVRREEALRKATNALISEAQAESATGAANEPTIGIEERQAVTTALQALSEVQREALVLAYFGGRTYREVAVELGIPEGTAKTRLRDGLIRLRELMGSGSP
jgi:RNA polymerase sigma-70 factor (ECF subfamily)